MDYRDTPAFEKASEYLYKMNSVSGRQYDENLSYDAICTAVVAAFRILTPYIDGNSLVTPADTSLIITIKGLRALEKLAAKHPDSAKTIHRITWAIAFSWCFSTDSLLMAQSEIEFQKVKPLLDKSAKANDAKRKAQKIARDVWAADLQQEFRISEMSLLVRTELERIGITPPSDKRVKEWLKPIAPRYASVSGRPKRY